MARKTMREMLLGSLTDREMAVLRLRFGLTEEVEGEFRATREQILAAEKRALEKLKSRK